MALSDQVDQDLIAAMKAKEALKVSVLRMLKSSLNNLAFEKEKETLEDSQVMEVIAKLIKQRKESIEAFTQGNRPELAQKEEMEMKLLQAYLPEALSDEALKTIVNEVIAELGVSGPSAMGQVMKGVLAKVAGRADGKVVSTLVKETLAG